VFLEIPCVIYNPQGEMLGSGLRCGSTSLPFNRPEAQADVDTIAAMEGNQKHNGPLENKWRANE
jgi:hypothetical protein